MEKEVEKPKRSRISNPNIRPNVRATSAGTGLRSLEKKNKELSNATKELEEKMKNLKNRTQNRALPKVSKYFNWKLVNSLVSRTKSTKPKESKG